VGFVLLSRISLRGGLAYFGKMKRNSVKIRFFTTFITNILRLGISFIAGIVIARALGPGEYGNLSFLLGSFTSLATLVNMASSSAFYTFISQKQRGWKFFLYYAVWVLFQLLILLVLVLFLPDSIRQKIWLGHPFELILLALVASFTMNQIWAFVGQIGESIRDTVGVQIRNLAVAMTYLICVVILTGFQILSIKKIFILNVSIYLLFSILYAWSVYRTGILSKEGDDDFKAILGEFKGFCLPLIFYTGIAFLYSFADNWLLQKFGGSVQQGYYAIGIKFSTLSLIATSSILQVFWKEIAEANSLGNMERVRLLYSRISRALYFIGALISCIMIPFTRDILSLFLGSSYQDAWLPLSILFLCPLYQSMGQITSTILYATEKTKTQSYIWICVMSISIPVSYLLLGSKSASISGFQLGAMGLAIKSLGVLILGVNLSAFFVTKHIKANFEWKHQINVLLLFLPAGFLTKFLSQYVLSFSAFDGYIILVMIFSGVFYLAISAAFVYFFPSIAGLSREMIKHAFARVRALINPA
jgi:O-antigen/teichoic acid export membrane protein